MKWYWAAIICGLILPWVVMFKTVRIGYERGIQSGLGAWFGISIITVPVTLLLFWIAQLVVK